MFVSSNYIRKIDELGRIVIPKEIRNKLKIKDNENIEIISDTDSIRIKKFSYISNYKIFIKDLCELVNEIYKLELTIYDNDEIIFTNNSSESEIFLTENIIKDSIVVGKILIYDNSINTRLLIKFIARLISLLISIY